MRDWLGGLTSRWSRAVHDLKEEFQGPGPNMILDGEPLEVRCDRSRLPADVILEPEAQQVLAPSWNRPGPDFSEIFVLLAEADGHDGKHVDIYVNENRLGRMTAADSTEFLKILALARADGRQAVGEAIRDRDASGGWALHVYRPEAS
jgi:hypothetical protein